MLHTLSPFPTRRVLPASVAAPPAARPSLQSAPLGAHSHEPPPGVLTQAEWEDRIALEVGDLSPRTHLLIGALLFVLIGVVLGYSACTLVQSVQVPS